MNNDKIESIMVKNLDAKSTQIESEKSMDILLDRVEAEVRNLNRKVYRIVDGV